MEVVVDGRRKLPNFPGAEFYALGDLLSVWYSSGFDRGKIGLSGVWRAREAWSADPGHDWKIWKLDWSQQCAADQSLYQSNMNKFDRGNHKTLPLSPFLNSTTLKEKLPVVFIGWIQPTTICKKPESSRAASH